MKAEKRINIGLFVNSIQNDYSTLLCKGAAIAAEELDANLLIVPGREYNGTWDNIEINRFENQNNVLYSYITSNNIDVLIVSLGTVGFFLNDDEKKAFLEQYKGIKVIAMDSEIEGYPSIVFSLDGLRSEIEHVIKVHNRKKIAFLSGPENNSVAKERLELYKKIMAENNLPLYDSYIAYGDFTDYCDEIVEELFEKNRENMPEVICCANDSMVQAVRRVCVKHELKVGRDILVTGYDDAVFANVMDPPLTTVKANIMTMGYQAVESAVRYHLTGAMEKTYVKTSLIVRQSCGCDSDSVRVSETRGISIQNDREKLISNIIAYTIRKSSLDILPKRQIDALRKFINDIYIRIISGEEHKRIEAGSLIAELMCEENMDFFTFDAINALMYAIRKLALERFDKENHGIVFSVFEQLFRHVSLQFAEESHNIEKRMISDRFVFARIADDMMASGSDENEGYRHLMNDISNLKVKSCYMYMYHSSMLDFHSGSEKKSIKEWVRPQHIYLKALYENGRCTVPPQKDQRMMYDRFLNHKYMPYDKRRTMVMQALYFNDEQYGIMLIETEIGVISEVMNISKQICTAIKLTQFMNQLEGALDDVRKVNIKLSAESVSDQLTGVYNRRGFINESEKIMQRCSLEHHSGAVLYADLDYLKIINDTFGHKEGDFAIRKISDLLVHNLRSSDIVGRVGGDEFVAFIMDIDKTQLETICQRIRDCADDFNSVSDKPYNIGVSMGMYFFDTYDRETIDQLMSGADRDLYNNKKNKSRSVLKAQ